MKNNLKKRVVIAMSGGVDSSVAAKLIKDQGFDVAGIFLHFWKDPQINSAEAENKCCSTKALMDARRVCQKIGIPLYTMNFSDVFKNKIVDNFLSEYKIGRTPNPCVLCNELVKLGLLVEKAQKLGFDFVASGHYVHLKKRGDSFHLERAKDFKKDQSYFLYRLKQEHLKKLLFPLGDYTKEEVRKMAKKFKLPVAEKKESQEICFIPEKSHNDFLKRNLILKPGKIKTLDDKTIGEHQGLPLYTIGQRRGIEIGGDGPYYAVKMDYKKNVLYVTNNRDDRLLHKDTLVAKKVIWASAKFPELPFSCEAVVRYGQVAFKCAIVEKNKKGDLLIKLDKAERAITPGQSVVFYNKNEVLGGGIIED